MNNYPRIPLSTVVIVTREVKSFYSTPDVHGPKTLRKAIADKDLPTHGGTVSVRVIVAEGEYKGGNVFNSNGNWYVQPVVREY